MERAVIPGLPEIGSVAPDFTLPSTSGSDVTLSALRGKRVLIAFFPLAFTGTCTTELCTFSEDFGRFADADTVVLPISVDSVPTLKAFKAKEHITVDLLSDFKRTVCKAYGTFLEERFHSSRAYILVDATGVVRWTHVETVVGQFRSTEELLERVKAAA